MLKIIILSFCLITTLVSATQENTKLSYNASLILLDEMKQDAIILGTGQKILYVFIDPLCKHSCKFVRMVSKSPKMLSKYQYHFFLYAIPRLKSSEVISAIYLSENPLQTQLDVMVKKKISYHKDTNKTKAKIDRINTVAQKIAVSKRPYIFIVK
ncbi:MAG: Unknown protein [uncultured Sulfurovum sp.]|uniref:Thioredoxin-like fold domain-containing protein n=1 Tax=uncultured Sulfurovum sp. TaxID=269237 RepID=A0A6S6SP18_9BACT|nr:MAG: Unknown protein [uncultured Sulfurovum sp.]